MLSEKPWTVERIVYVLLGMATGICLVLLLGGVLQYFHGSKTLTEESPSYVIIEILSIHGSIFGAVAFVLWFQQITWQQAFGFSVQTIPRSILWGFIGAVVLVPAGGLLENGSEKILEWLHLSTTTQEAVQMLQKVQNPASRCLLIFFAVAIAPVAEEIFFRGILYPAIKRLGWPKTALWTTSVLFGAIHLNLSIFIPLTAVAMALVFLYEKTDNLLAPIVAHGIFNTVNVIELYHEMSHGTHAGLLHWFA